jgi:fatty-acyl-CoA synthase
LITPTTSGIARRTTFPLLTEALAYAATGASGFNFLSARGELKAAVPYHALQARAVALARRLLALDLRPGDRVALIAETSPEFVTSFLACVHANLLPVPLPAAAAFSDRKEYVERIRHQLAHCGARLLLRPEGLSLSGDAGEHQGRVLDLSWAELERGPASDEELPALQPDGLCYLQYSSGSTRFPRGVAVTHRALMRNCHEIAVHALGVAEHDRVVSWLPFYHDMGLVGTLLTALTCQLSVDLIAPEDFARRPVLWLQLISRHRGTAAYGPCFGYDLCRRRATAAQILELDLSSWRIAGVGGEMIAPNIMERFAQTFAPAGFRREAIVASYGLAEATLGVTFAPLGSGLATDKVDRSLLARQRRAERTEDGGAQVFVRCGRPLPSHRIEIRDSAGRPLPARGVGRIFIRGDSVMQGYFDDPESTATVIDGEGWLDTGDVGYLVDGELVIVGRSKDTIIVNGRNIWPQDLEWTLEQLPEVRSQDCAAFGISEPEQGEIAVVLIQCRSRSPAERAALASAARRVLLQASGVDCRIVLVPPHSLPRTSSGKLNRNMAREKYQAGLFETAVELRQSA